MGAQTVLILYTLSQYKDARLTYAFFLCVSTLLNWLFLEGSDFAAKFDSAQSTYK